MAALTLPPQSEGFPEVALIHGVLALTAQFTGEKEGVERYWDGDGVGQGKTQVEYHAVLGKAAVDGLSLFLIAPVAVGSSQLTSSLDIRSL